MQEPTIPSDIVREPEVFKPSGVSERRCRSLPINRKCYPASRVPRFPVSNRSPQARHRTAGSHHRSRPARAREACRWGGSGSQARFRSRATAIPLRNRSCTGRKGTAAKSRLLNGVTGKVRALGDTGRSRSGPRPYTGASHSTDPTGPGNPDRPASAGHRRQTPFAFVTGPPRRGGGRSEGTTPLSADHCHYSCICDLRISSRDQH